MHSKPLCTLKSTEKKTSQSILPQDSDFSRSVGPTQQQTVWLSELPCRPICRRVGHSLNVRVGLGQRSRDERTDLDITRDACRSSCQRERLRLQGDAADSQWEF